MSFDKGNGNEPEAAEAVHAAHYIACLTEQLSRLADSHGLDMLAYILDMARLEADQIVKDEDEPNEPAGPC